MRKDGLSRNAEVSDPAYRTWVVAREMGYDKGKCTQGQLAEARGISRETANRHLQQVGGVTKVSHPYILYRCKSRGAPVDAQRIGVEIRAMAEAERRVRANGYHCLGLGCLGELARWALEEPLERHRAEELEVWDGGRWSRLLAG